MYSSVLCNKTQNGRQNTLLSKEMKYVKKGVF
ncbi:hypothetical protein E2C01_029255 [Portunus trituberculatus]|uniref:Uncharacterized protein n=1 Tax=Portunus trituberculatus TaxID=210409 RepID=A0A5B7ERB3_PORTR|nr:hypothetical protein [Portunus trituberculatus]